MTSQLRGHCSIQWQLYLALIYRAGGVYRRILTEFMTTDRMQSGLYARGLLVRGLELKLRKSLGALIN